MRSQRSAPRSLEGLHLVPQDPPTTPDHRLADGNLLLRALRGQAPLAAVWWKLGLPLRIGSMVLNSDWMFESLYGESLSVRHGVAWATIVASAIWSGMAWRCAPNVEAVLWKWVARGLIVIAWTRLVHDWLA